MNKHYARTFWEVLIGSVLALALVFVGVTALTLQGELTDTRQEASQTAEELEHVQNDLDDMKTALRGAQDALEACSAQNDDATGVADTFYDVLAYLAGASYAPPSERAINEAFSNYETLEACK